MNVTISNMPLTAEDRQSAFDQIKSCVKSGHKEGVHEKFMYVWYNTVARCVLEILDNRTDVSYEHTIVYGAGDWFLLKWSDTTLSSLEEETSEWVVV